MPGRWSPEPGELQYTDQLFQHLHTQRGLARVGVLDLDRDVFAAWRKPVAIRLLRIVDALDQHRVESAGRRLYRFASTIRRSRIATRSAEHTSELQSLMRTSYAVFCLKKKNFTPSYRSTLLLIDKPTYNNIHPHTS